MPLPRPLVPVIVCLATTSWIAPPRLHGDASAIVRSEFIYEAAPFPSCHASTIAEASDGTLVAAWFGGQYEKHPEVGIWVSRLEAPSWSTPTEVADGVQYAQADGTLRRHPCWNPVLFQPRQGPLLLFYKVGPSPETWWGMLTTSVDGGRTWSPPQRLPEHIDGPVKNRPIELPDGALLCPSSTEHDGVWRVHFERTPDLGRTWWRSGPCNDGREIEAIQPSILSLADGRLLAVGRSRQDRIFQLLSRDGGQTWDEMTLGNLPNPNSGTDALTLRDGRHVLVYNHVPGEPGKWGGKRSPLNLAISRDGFEWQAALVLEHQPGQEFSYPAVIQTSDGLLHVTYTWKRQRIRHVVIDPGQLEGRDMPDGRWPE